MFVLKGKYNIARVMIDNVDETTISQIYSFLNHPAFSGEPISIMPDCHAGSGAVIGFTFPFNDYVIPNVVGVDIGCGMCSYNLGKIDVDVIGLDNFVKGTIPAGFTLNNWKNPTNKVKEFVEMFGFENYGRFTDMIEHIDTKLDKNKTRDFMNSIGTLGGGNHFIELGKDQDDSIWLTVHTGSRNFGLQIAKYHQNKAKEFMKKVFHGADAFKDLEFLPLDMGGNEYLEDMSYAQKYAKLNRRVILYRIIMGFFKENFKESNMIEAVHNYIDFDDKIIRKGAIRSYVGEKLIIPFNMEDGLIIGEGKSNDFWNFSAPHGAGRVLSRKKAKELLNLEDAVKSMSDNGVYTTSLNKSTLDECKLAYKNKDDIISAIEDSVKIDHFVKPLWNYKAGEE